MKRNFSIISVVLLAPMLITAGCGASSTKPASAKQADKQVKQTTRMIMDTAGKQVTIPATINRIADSRPAHNEVLAMLGAGDKIVATVHTPQSRPWLYKVNPAMNKAVNTFNPVINVEELVKTKPDIAFMTVGDPNVQNVTETGIPAVQLTFTILLV